MRWSSWRRASRALPKMPSWKNADILRHIAREEPLDQTVKAFPGLKRARELGVQEVEVFADSELMIRQLGGRYQVKSPSLRPLYEEALKLLNDFSRVKLVHVPREMNAAADEMSNRAIDERL